MKRKNEPWYWNSKETIKSIERSFVYEIQHQCCITAEKNKKRNEKKDLKKLYKNASNNRDSKLRSATNIYTFCHEIFENEKKKQKLETERTKIELNMNEIPCSSD